MSHGFTLLELITVIAILVVVAGGVLFSLAGTQEQAEDRVAVAEIAQVREAVTRFRADTGFWPKTGPFGLVGGNGGRIDPTDPTHWPAPLASSSAAERTAWFHSPANLYQLFQRQDDPGNLLRIAGCLDAITGGGGDFDPTTGRGFRGPYISQLGEGDVVVGDQIALDPVTGHATGDGDPAAGGLLPAVAGVADPHAAPELETGHFLWTTALGEPLGQRGRPFLVFTRDPLTDADPSNDGELGPRIVALGQNGRYESDRTAIGGDDLVAGLER